LSTTLLKGERSELSEEQRLERLRLRVNERSSTAAEKSGEGMAFKIFTGAKLFLKAYKKPIDITEIKMLSHINHDVSFLLHFSKYIRSRRSLKEIITGEGIRLHER